MARQRLPTNVLALKGHYKKNPKRIVERIDEPEAMEPISKTPPSYMSAEQKNAYIYIISHCHPDVLCVADQAATEVVACLLAQFRHNPLRMDTGRISRLLAGLGSLGMTPADRSRVQTMKRNQKASEFGEFLES